MPYCSHCGELATGQRFCAACGAPVAPDAVAAIAHEARRRRTEMRLIAAVLGLLLAVSAGLVVSHSKHAGREGQASTPVQQLPIAPTDAEASPRESMTDAAPDSQPHPPASVSPGPDRDVGSRSIKNEDGNLPPARQQVPSNFGHDAHTPPAESTTGAKPRSQQDASPGSDRYPGSQPVTVENANLPDIGVPFETEVYATSDSLSAVTTYYRQLYPDAQVTDVNGQTVIAVARPGATKAIALGTTGSETRIAIVRAN